MLRPRMYVKLAVAFGLAGAPALAVDPVFLASQNMTLYRAADGGIESFSTGVEMLSMFYDSQLDAVLVGSRGVPGNVPLYTLDHALSGDPVLQPFATLNRFYGSITRIGGLYFGFHEGELYSIDLSNLASPIETFIGATGLSTSGGCAYDAATDTLYVFARETDRLYRVDRNNAELSVIGEVADDFGGTGLEWWDGQLFVSVQNFSSGEFEIGTLSTADATYDRVLSLGVPARPQSTSLAIVPEPSAGVTLLAAFAAIWRAGRRAER